MRSIASTCALNPTMALGGVFFAVWILQRNIPAPEVQPDSPALWTYLGASYALFALWLIPRFRANPCVFWALAALILFSSLFYYGSIQGTYAEWAVGGLSVVLGILWLATFGIRPRPYATLTVLAVILTMWGTLEIAARVTSPLEALFGLGAQSGPRIESGEYWRLFTSTLLHSGFSHVISNGIDILVLGHLVERFFGRIKFLSIFVITGIAGNVAGYVYADNTWSLISLGASGALFGLAGALVVFCMSNPGRLLEFELRSRVIAILVVALITSSFAFEFWTALTNNSAGFSYYAHTGGFVAGLLLGFAMLPRSQSLGRASGYRNGWSAGTALATRRWWALPTAVVVLAGGVFIGNDRTPMVYTERANEHLVQRDFNLARDDVQRALDKDPDYGPALLLRARFQMEDGNLGVALSLTESAVYRLSGPEQSEALRLLAEIRCKHGAMVSPDSQACSQYLE